MTNLRILHKNSWTKSGTMKDRVKCELRQYGYGRIFNETDFYHYQRQNRNEMRRSGIKGGGNPSQ
jgi:hypothetical protein